MSFVMVVQIHILILNHILDYYLLEDIEPKEWLKIDPETKNNGNIYEHKFSAILN